MVARGWAELGKKEDDLDYVTFEFLNF